MLSADGIIELSQIRRNFMHKNRRTSISPAESRELGKLAYGVRKMLEDKEEADNLKYAEEHQNGYCPHCFGLIRLNGKCDNCD